MKISAAVLRDHHEQFGIEEIDLLHEPCPHQVLVKVVATGLCHTDLAIRDQDMPTAFPVLLGHEGAGIVEAVGSDVSRVKPGDAVILAPASCYKCQTCLSGHPSYCEVGMALNLPGTRPDGTFAYHDHAGEGINADFFGQSSFGTYCLAKEVNVIRVGDDVPLEILGPLAARVGSKSIQKQAEMLGQRTGG